MSSEKQKGLKLGLIALSILLLVVGFGLNSKIKNYESKIEEYRVVSRSAIAGLDVMWQEIEVVGLDWVEGNITREEMAQKALVMYDNLEEVKARVIEVKGQRELDGVQVDLIVSSIEGLVLKTDVMIFDMLRGYSLVGNPYNEKEKYADEILNYVLPKRKVAFDRDFKSFIDGELSLPYYDEDIHGEM